jgi:AcrR family transcriptional regulator
MGRRADHTPEQLRALVLDASGKIVAEEGEPALTTRRVAKEIGYTSGTLYNVFRDRGDLILALNGVTLDELYDALERAPSTGDVRERLRGLARAYIAYVRKQPERWRLVFEHRSGEKEPDWYPPKVAKLFGLIENAIAPFYGAKANERGQAARMLWAGFHGMCSLESKGALAFSATTLIELLIDHYVAAKGAAAPKAARRAAR